MTLAESMTLPENNNDKLKLTLFTSLLNRDSLSRQIPQELQIFIDYLINYVVSSIYASLDRALNKDEKNLKMLEDVAQEHLDLLWDLKQKFFERKLND